MTRKITTILLALALCLTLLPVGAGAATEGDYVLQNEGNTLKCGSSDVGTGNATVKYDNGRFTATVSGYVLDGGTAGATYTLGDDVTIGAPLIIKGTVTLDLNGKVLKMTGSVIVVANNAHFTLKDNAPAKYNNYSYTIAPDTNAFILYTPTSTTTAPKNANKITGGIITGGTGTKPGSTSNSTASYTIGGGVFVGGNATFNMTGGNIVGCTATGSGSGGGGVYIASPLSSGSTTFNMSGGSIVGCTATTNGGGVYNNKGTFTMSNDSAIVGCTATNNSGGGVHNSGTFTMSGSSTIKNCTANNKGGGVFADSGTFTMEGGTINNCTANYIDAKSDGVYIGNSAATMDAKGGSVNGNVYVNSAGTLINNSENGGRTNFTGTITNGGGKISAKALTKPSDFLCWVVESDTSTDYCQKVVFTGGDEITRTSGTFRAFLTNELGGYEVEVSGTDPQGTTDGYYKTFTNAWNRAQGDSPTFTLLKDVNAGTLTCSKRGAKLDLNEHTLTADITIDEGSSLEYVFTVKGGGTLSGTVTAGASYAKLQVAGGTVNAAIAANGGTVRCAGGTITTATVNNDGTLECSSGTIKNLTVTGGTVNCGEDSTSTGTIENLTVNGGTLNCKGGTIKNLTVTGGTVNHTGGTATCTEQAECSVCGHSYGEKDTSNHAAGCVLDWTVKNATQHKKAYNLCGTVEVELQNHKWENGKCKDCEHICTHSGNNPTCTESSTCTICGKEFAAKGHTGTGYNYDSSKHWQACAICGKPFDEAAHDFGSGNTCVCGRGAPTILAVLSHPDAASATDYTSGIHGLTFRSTASFASFRGVQVDGKTIAATNYTAKEGSIVVYLKAEYLQTLPKGAHTVTILSAEGNATADFTIGGAQSPETGDSGVAVYAVMALASCIGTALTFRGRKRK